LGLRAARPAPANGDAIPLTYDDGRELRDQVIDRATRLRIDRQGIGLANPAADLQTELRLRSGRAFPPRFALWNAGSLSGDLYQGTLQSPCPSCARWACVLDARAPATGPSSRPPRHHERHQLHGALPARPAGRKADWDIVLKAMDDGQQLVTSTCSSRSSPSRRR
jgi:conjugal transfer ATP-binding protein TraC